MSHRKPLVLSDIKTPSQLPTTDTVVVRPRSGAVSTIGDASDYPGDIFVATDENNTYRSNGTTWDRVGTGVSGTGTVESVVAGTGCTVDSTDPANPIVNVTGGGGSGVVETIVPGDGITVDDTDPANPIVSIDPAVLRPAVISHSADATLAATDENSVWRHPAADTTPRTWAIPANGSVALPDGFTMSMVNEGSAGAISIPITTDTLYWAGTWATGTRSLAPGGFATLLKLTSTTWVINGVGLS